MNRPHIGSAPECGDPRLWRFERQFGLSRDYFAPRARFSPDACVLIVALAILAGIVAALLTGVLQ